jgi:hypothetical protein
VSYSCSSSPNNLPKPFTLKLDAAVTNTGGCGKSSNVNSTQDGDAVPVVTASAVSVVSSADAVSSSRFCTGDPVSFVYRVNSSVGYTANTPNWSFNHVVDSLSRASDINCPVNPSSVTQINAGRLQAVCCPCQGIC